MLTTTLTAKKDKKEHLTKAQKRKLISKKGKTVFLPLTKIKIISFLSVDQRSH